MENIEQIVVFPFFVRPESSLSLVVGACLGVLPLKRAP
jgi:hypothetical protein